MGLDSILNFFKIPDDFDDEYEEEYVEELKVPAQQDGKNVTLESYEREAVKLALLRNYGKRKEAAKELGISERTLYRKIKEYGLE